MEMYLIGLRYKPFEAISQNQNLPYPIKSLTSLWLGRMWTESYCVVFNSYSSDDSKRFDTSFRVS